MRRRSVVVPKQKSFMFSSSSIKSGIGDGAAEDQEEGEGDEQYDDAEEENDPENLEEIGNKISGVEETKDEMNIVV
jgi:hypothetical protein